MSYAEIHEHILSIERLLNERFSAAHAALKDEGLSFEGEGTLFRATRHRGVPREQQRMLDECEAWKNAVVACGMLKSLAGKAVSLQNPILGNA